MAAMKGRGMAQRWIRQYGGRGWLALVALLAGLPISPLVALGPQQTVRSVNPKMGIHTRLTDEVEPWKIKRTLEMVREMGATWIVEYFPWAYYEPSPGRFDWTHADLVVDHARRQGLTVIARLGFVPEWARPDPEEQPTTFTYLDEEHYTAFAEYAHAFVEHFRGRVGYVVVWNEPNISLEWGYRPVDPEGYTALLGAVHARAKAADPDAPADPAAVNWNRTELLRQLLVESGYGELPIYITEGGWNDHPRWTKSVQPAQRAAFTLRAYQKALEEWPWCEAVILWAFRYPRPANTYQDYFTFVTTDFTPKPIYFAVQRYARGEEP
jgi:hypothetical protein